MLGIRPRICVQISDPRRPRSWHHVAVHQFPYPRSLATRAAAAVALLCALVVGLGFYVVLRSESPEECRQTELRLQQEAAKRFDMARSNCGSP